MFQVSSLTQIDVVDTVLASSDIVKAPCGGCGGRGRRGGWQGGRHLDAAATDLDGLTAEPTMLVVSNE